MARPKRSQTTVKGLQPVQLLAGVVGLAYLALGIIGFLVTGFDGGFAAATHSTLWVFSVNPLHNVFHVVVGVLGVLMALTSGLARSYGWLLLVVFGVLLLWGLAITGLFANNPVSGLGNPFALDTADNWLHLGTAVLGLILAVMPARKVVEAPGGTAGQAEAAESTTERTHTSEAPSGSRGRAGGGRRLWRRGAAH